MKLKQKLLNKVKDFVWTLGFISVSKVSFPTNTTLVMTGRTGCANVLAYWYCTGIPVNPYSLRVKNTLFFSLFWGGIWPHWKADTGKHNFHEILLLNWAKRLKNCWMSSQHTPSPNAHWLAQCNRLRTFIRSEVWSRACVFRTTLLLPSTATCAGWNSKCRCHQQKNKRPWPA